jgi:protein TonB
LTIHALLFLACVVLLQQRAAQTPPHPLTWVEFDTSLPKTLKDRIKDEEFRKRIVQTEKGTKTEKAPKDAFLGAQNQQVDIQSVSRNRTTEMGDQKSKQAQVAPLTKPKQAAKARQANREKAEEGRKELSELGIPILPKKRDPAAAAQAEQDIPQWSNYGARPEDWVQDVKESERTALNTKEYVFYGYFQRIRERLDRAWVPILREKLVRFYHSGRQLASDMDHTTKVLVVLNSGGEIVKVQVLSESGTRDLDDAAVKAFNQAGPFPNPPHGIIDPNGLISIPWEFILKT